MSDYYGRETGTPEDLEKEKARKKRAARIFGIVVLAAVLIFIGYRVFINYLKVEKDIDNLVGLDKDNSLMVVDFSKKNSERQTYIARSHVKKGIIWKVPIDRYEGPLYESRYRRDVMKKDRAVSFYLGDENRLIKFNYENGDILDTLDLPAPMDYVRWTAFHDSDTIYLLYEIDEDNLGLKAVDFDSFKIRWEINLGKPSNIYFYGRPLQNERWIVLHSETGNPENGLWHNALIIDKLSGETTEFGIASRGFLKDDNYYFTGLSPDFKNSAVMMKRELKTGDIKTLFPLDISYRDEGNSAEEKRLFPVLLNDTLRIYKEKLIYFAALQGNSERSFMITRNFQTGGEIKQIAFPEGYSVITSGLNLFLDGAPEFAGVPELNGAFLPQLTGYSGSEGFDGEMIRVKVLIFDIENGKISWESNSVYQPWRVVENCLEADNFYDEGMFGIFIPIPEAYRNMYQALLLIDENTGEITQCVRFYKKDSMYAAFNFAYRGRQFGDGRIFSFSDQAFYRPDGTIDGKKRNRYKIEDMREELGAIYGF